MKLLEVEVWSWHIVTTSPDHWPKKIRRLSLEARDGEGTFAQAEDMEECGGKGGVKNWANLTQDC